MASVTCWRKLTHTSIATVLTLRIHTRYASTLVNRVEKVQTDRASSMWQPVRAANNFIMNGDEVKVKC